MSKHKHHDASKYVELRTLRHGQIFVRCPGKKNDPGPLEHFQYLNPFGGEKGEVYAQIVSYDLSSCVVSFVKGKKTTEFKPGTRVWAHEMPKRRRKH